MEANELMIGDIVRLVYRVGTFVSKVNLENLIDNREGKMKYEPIPLTAEILEKNGFTKVNSQRYDYGYPDTDCYVKVNPKKNMIHVNGRNANCNLYDHSFIHELQHALRLCGLNELADNFKVE